LCRLLLVVLLFGLPGLITRTWAQSIRDEQLPQFVQGASGVNNNRIPFYCRLSLTGLTPGATYAYYHRCVDAADPTTTTLFGNMLLLDPSGPIARIATPGFTPGRHGVFTADAAGAYSGWFGIEPTAHRGFAAGRQIRLRLHLNDGAGGAATAHRLTSAGALTVLDWATTRTGPGGTGLVGHSSFAPRSVVLLYGDDAPDARPLASAMVEDDGLDCPDSSYVNFHDELVDGALGAWGTIIPNALPAGVRRIEAHAFDDGRLLQSLHSADGTWPPAATDTKNPAGGHIRPIVIRIGGDDPNIEVVPAELLLSAAAEHTTATGTVWIRNTGAAESLTVTGAVIDGPGAARFAVHGELPPAIASASSAPLTLTYQPRGSLAPTTATLRIASNDGGGDVPAITLRGSAALGPGAYEGLLIAEIATRPTADEFIEIVNLADRPLDLAGVIVSDEDDGITEGALRFPAGVVLAPGEIALIAAGAAADPPGWLPALPAPPPRVFHEPGRDVAAWAAWAQPQALEDFPRAAGGTSGRLALAAADGVALLAPGTRFEPGVGPTPRDNTIDGVNYPRGNPSPACPINRLGALDSPATKAGEREPAAGMGLTRIRPGMNTASDAAFAVLPVTPGRSELIPAPQRTGLTDWPCYH